MLDTTFMTFGDKVYRVNEINNSFSRNRITMIDENGVEWHRYDSPRWEHVIEEVVYCGKTVVSILGEVRDQEDMRTQMHFKYPDGQVYWEYEEDLNGAEHFFATRKEAEEYVARMKEYRAYK